MDCNKILISTRFALCHTNECFHCLDESYRVSDEHPYLLESQSSSVGIARLK